MDLAEKIARAFIVKSWPGGGYVFRMDKEVSLFGASYIPPAGNIGGMCWVEKIEDAVSVILKYPEYVEISVPIKRLMEMLKEDGDMGEEFNKMIDKIESMVKIQTTDGNWNYDPYMYGMANGLTLALATIKGVEPEFLDAPEKWISEEGEKAGRPTEVSDG